MISYEDLFDAIILASGMRLRRVGLTYEVFLQLIERLMHVVFKDINCVCRKQLEIRLEKLFPSDNRPPWVWSFLEADQDIMAEHFSVFDIKRMVRVHAGDIPIDRDDAHLVDNVIFHFIEQLVLDMLEQNEDQILSGERELTKEHMIDYLVRQGGYERIGFDRAPLGPFEVLFDEEEDEMQAALPAPAGIEVPPNGNRMFGSRCSSRSYSGKRSSRRRHLGSRSRRSSRKMW